MQWTRIKTLFIFSFLILDLFLLTQLLGKQQEEDVRITENEDTSLEQQLDDENINVEVTLDQEQLEGFYISVGQKTFNEDDKGMLKDLDDQTPVIIDDKLIVSELDKSIKIPEEASSEKISNVADQLFLYPGQYNFWNWNKDKNILMFFQEKNDRPVYYNPSGIVLMFLNEDNEIDYYTQTMLGDAEKSGDKKELISLLNAIGKLYYDNELNTDDTITKVDIGYHTMLPLPNGIQSFAPSWKITVNDDKQFFVNAIEKRIFSSDELEFLEEDAIGAMYDKVADAEIDTEDKKKIMKRFEEKMGKAK